MTPLLKTLQWLSVSFRVKVRAFREALRPYVIYPWPPSRIWTSSPTSTSWPLLPPCSPLNILSTLSLRDLCTPDLSAWRLCAHTSAGLALCFLSGLCSNIISHWSLPWPPYVNYNCPQALLSGPPSPFLCFSFLHTTCQHHLTFHVFYFIYLLSIYLPRESYLQYKVDHVFLMEGQHNLMFMIPGSRVRLLRFEPWFYHSTFCASLLLPIKWG